MSFEEWPKPLLVDGDLTAINFSYDGRVVVNGNVNVAHTLACRELIVGGEIKVGHTLAVGLDAIKLLDLRSK